MSHSGYVVRHYVIWDYVAFGDRSFGIMLHSAFCRIPAYFVRDCVVRRNIVRLNVVQHNEVLPTVGVGVSYFCRLFFVV